MEFSGEMPEYIGTKLVRAVPMSRGDYIAQAQHFITKGHEDLNAPGYKVIYEDGYESWSPKETFEKAYRRTTGLNFGLAIEAAKMGKKIARAGWNGKNQYVELGHNLQYDTYDSGWHAAYHNDIDGKAFVFVGTRGSQVGWLASQSDMLADDWYIVE